MVTVMLKLVGYLDARKGIYLICACALIVFGSCMSPLEQSRKRFADEQMKEISHPAGLVLRLPESLEAQVRPDGFYVLPSDPSQRNMRYPVGATLRLHPNEAQPEGEWQQKETIGERVIWYRIMGGDGYGSGGAEYEFNAWESYANGYIAYQQRDQRESGEPDFSICWQIIDGLKAQNQ